MLSDKTTIHVARIVNKLLHFQSDNSMYYMNSGHSIIRGGAFKNNTKGLLYRRS